MDPTPRPSPPTTAADGEAILYRRRGQRPQIALPLAAFKGPQKPEKKPKLDKGENFLKLEKALDDKEMELTRGR